MDILKAFLMGLIQGVTEFLPVSSSGHLSVFSHFFNIDTEISSLYSSMLHIGSVIAIVVFFYKTIYELFIEFTLCIKEIAKKRFSFDKEKTSKTRQRKCGGKALSLHGSSQRLSKRKSCRNTRPRIGFRVRVQKNSALFS